MGSSGGTGLTEKREVADLAVRLDPGVLHRLEGLGEQKLAGLHIGLGDEKFALDARERFAALFAFGQLGAEKRDFLFQHGDAGADGSIRAWLGFSFASIWARESFSWVSWVSSALIWVVRSVTSTSEERTLNFSCSSITRAWAAMTACSALHSFRGALHRILAQALGQLVDLFLGIGDELARPVGERAGSGAITSIFTMPSVGS